MAFIDSILNTVKNPMSLLNNVLNVVGAARNPIGTASSYLSGLISPPSVSKVPTTQSAQSFIGPQYNPPIGPPYNPSAQTNLSSLLGNQTQAAQVSPAPSTDRLSQINARISDLEAKGKSLSNSKEYAKLVKEREGLGGTQASRPQSQSPQQIIDDMMKTIDKQVKDEQSFVSKLIDENPFAFDEELAKQSARAEYDPYYGELLNDYLADIDVRRKTVQDQQQLQRDLNRLETGQQERDFQKALANAEEGFAGRGLFFSGIKERGLGEINVEQADIMEKRGLTTATGGREFERQIGTLGTEEERKRRDLEREREAAIESGTLQRRQEALTEHFTPIVQTISRRFPSSQNALGGYGIPEFVRF